jgi:hypothetical protein
MPDDAPKKMKHGHQGEGGGPKKKMTLLKIANTIAKGAKDDYKQRATLVHCDPKYNPQYGMQRGRLEREIMEAYLRLGGVDYLVQIGHVDHRAFLALLGKVIQTQTNGSMTMEEDSNGNKKFTIEFKKAENKDNDINGETIV